MISNVDFENQFFFIFCLCKNQQRLEKLRYNHSIDAKFAKIEKAFDEFLKDLQNGYDNLLKKMKDDLDDAYIMNTMNHINLSKEANEFLEHEYKDIIAQHRLRIFNVMVELEEEDKPKRRGANPNEDIAEGSDKHAKWTNFLQNFQHELEAGKDLKVDGNVNSEEKSVKEEEKSLSSHAKGDISFSRENSGASPESVNSRIGLKKNTIYCSNQEELDKIDTKQKEISIQNESITPGTRDIVELENIKVKSLTDKTPEDQSSDLTDKKNN
jgi:hypothetical protein